MATPLLITGASGYIGGSILTALCAHQDHANQRYEISALVRSEHQAALVEKQGVKAIVIDGFDDLDRMNSIAQSFDIIIHAGAGWHTASSKSLIQGLATRRDKAGVSPAYIQISGTSNLSDRPWSENFVESRVLSDDESVYEYEKLREAKEVYYQRTTDIAVVETGEKLGIPTFVVMAPTIFGLGTGLFNKFSVQLPAIIKDALKTGQVKVIGDGRTIWTHVHILDLTEFFLLLLEKIYEGANVPSGRRGIYFCETGEHTHQEMSQRLLDAGIKMGIFEASGLQSVSLEDAANAWAGGNKARVELAFGSNSRCKAVLARRLGWRPRNEDKWETCFATELAEYYSNPPKPKELPKVMQKGVKA